MGKKRKKPLFWIWIPEFGPAEILDTADIVVGNMDPEAALELLQVSPDNLFRRTI